MAWFLEVLLKFGPAKLLDSGYIKKSSQLLGKMDTITAVEECSEDSTCSSSYESAMDALSSLIKRQKRGERLAQNEIDKLERMRMYLKILGLEECLRDLKIIHVAGTKGKGSTCIFCEAILRECGFRTGLFTSPHLIDIRERFRINGLDISEEKFLQYFWACWNQLKENATERLPMPALFQFLTLLAFKIFLSEQVDVAIIEVGLGGKNDSTNVIKEPVVCGITSLGMDHTEILGNTIGEIASQKAGIFKLQVPAFTVHQLPEAMDVLLEHARELMVPLEVVEPLDYKKLKGLKLSLPGDHQLINSGLAVSLCKCWLQRTGHWERLFKNEVPEVELPDPFYRGLANAYLAGRAQVVYYSYSSTENTTTLPGNSFGGLIFYLDGAHSPESMEVCAKWFSSAVRGNNKPFSHIQVKNMEEFFVNGDVRREKNSEDPDEPSKQILLFNCMELRDPQILLPRLVNTCASSGTYFSKALFVPSISVYNKVTSGATIIPETTNKDLTWQFNLQRLWEKIIHGTDVDAALDRSSKTETIPVLPPHEFLYEDASQCSPADNNFYCSAVMPSLPLTVKWLRDCVKENPSVKVQVLVTGSLHLVGDVLKLLRR